MAKKLDSEAEMHDILASAAEQPETSDPLVYTKRVETIYPSLQKENENAEFQQLEGGIERLQTAHLRLPFLPELPDSELRAASNHFERSFPHSSCAISTSKRIFANCCSSVSSFPSMVLLKPH